MRIEVAQKIDFVKLAKEQVDFTPTEMFEIGAAARAAMIDRINKGQDANNRKMKEYSDAYKKRRKDLGKTTEVVNLEFTGKMKSSIQPRNAKENNVDLSVEVHQTAAYYTNEDRNWWGIDQQTYNAAVRQKDKILARKVR